MTVAVHFVLLALGHLVAVSPGVIAAWLVFGGRSLRETRRTEADPEMVRIAAWSDELQPGSCEL